jgi:hypothetical protein
VREARDLKAPTRGAVAACGKELTILHVDFYHVSPFFIVDAPPSKDLPKKEKKTFLSSF